MRFFKFGCDHIKSCSCLFKYLDYLEKNGRYILYAGRPAGTHNTVIGRNQLDLRRFDFAR